MDSINQFLVGAAGESHVMVMRPPYRSITKAEAVNLAVWLVAVADPERAAFDPLLAEVLAT